MCYKLYSKLPTTSTLIIKTRLRNSSLLNKTHCNKKYQAVIRHTTSVLNLCCKKYLSWWLTLKA